jgi:pyruvate dehydrogenase E2 component (dihydrolipoamide acetyltransferase)
VTSDIYAVIVPSWGMTMEEGTLARWHVSEGDTVQAGDELVDIETSKISNTLESQAAGILRRRIGEIGKTYPCGALIGVIAQPIVTDAAVETFISHHNVSAKPAATPAQTRIVEVGGVRINFLAAGGGSGRSTLLLHGLGGNLGNWTLLQTSLAATRLVVAVDLPGHGESSKDLGRIAGFGAIAELMLLLLDELQIPCADIVAHSMGAPIALEMARRSPSRITAIGLIAPAHLGQPVSGRFVNDLVSAHSRRQITDLLKELFVDPQRASREMAEAMLKARRIDGVTDAWMRYSSFLMEEPASAREALDGIRCPIAVFWGSEDRIITPVARGDLPSNAEVVFIEGAGHMPHIEQSAATAKEVARRLGCGSHLGERGNR